MSDEITGHVRSYVRALDAQLAEVHGLAKGIVKWTQDARDTTDLSRKAWYTRTLNDLVSDLHTKQAEAKQLMQRITECGGLDPKCIPAATVAPYVTPS